MRITFIKKNKVINSIEDWNELGHPKSAKQYFKKQNLDTVNTIGYQLVTSTRGTIYAAKEVKKCINLILVFTGNVEKESNYRKKVDKNDRDFNEFQKLVGVSADSSFLSRDGILCWLRKVNVQC